MKFGVNTSPRPPFTSAEAYTTAVQTAERLGFDFFSVSDHVVVPRENISRYPYNEEGKLGAAVLGHCFDQLTTLAFLAGCTDRIRLLSSVMVVPHRPPVLTAKILATADVLSGGRIILGAGAGWLREEFEALQTQPYDARGKVTDEYLEAFKALWTQDNPKYVGAHVSFDNVVFQPKPLQKPHIPIWIGGESAPAMRRAVKHGTAWYPGSRNPQFRLDTPARLSAAHDKLKRMAEAEKRDPATVGLSFINFTPVEFTARPGFDSPRAMMSGSPADMAADIDALARVGVTHLNLGFQQATLAETLERMTRFGEEVMPLVPAL